MKNIIRPFAARFLPAAHKFAVNFRPGKEKEVAQMCNLLVFSVDPEGHDPTTFGL